MIAVISEREIALIAGTVISNASVIATLRHGRCVQSAGFRYQPRCADSLAVAGQSLAESGYIIKHPFSQRYLGFERCKRRNQVFGGNVG